jgi:hypothetical protein
MHQVLAVTGSLVLPALAVPVQAAYLRNKKFEVISPGQNPVIDAKSNVHAGT